jgi:hypothetical protein
LASGCTRSIFNLSDDTEKMQPGEKISFGKLDFITDQLGNLRLQEPETPEQQEEQSHPVSLPDWRRLWTQDHSPSPAI